MFRDVFQADLAQNLQPLAAEIYLALAAFALLLVGVYRHPRVSGELLISVIVVLALGVLVLAKTAPGAASVVAMNGMFITDGFTVFVKVLILGGAALTLLIASGWLLEEGGRPFEFLLLIIFSVLGMMFMVSANHLLSVYLGLEMSSLALYVLTAFQRDDARASEAGLKYFVLGALASGMMLFGMSLIYGFAGALDFDSLARILAASTEEAGGTVSRAVVVGMVLVLIGLSFKVAAVPFHMWTPDVYEGAPTPVTAFLATASKIAAFALLTRLLLQPFADLIGQWRQIVVFISFASMAVGALAALRQTSIKRLLAYSSIGHAGFILMGLAAGSSAGVQGVLIYLSVYLFMSIGAFGCVLLMRRDGVYVEEISDLAGLSRTRPWIAFALGACMFSMAGIPPLAGFFGKMYVVLPAIEAGLVPLAVAGLLTSVISCYYYLRVVKFMYFDEPSEPLDAHAPAALSVGVAVSVAVVLFYFTVPGPLIGSARAAASLLLQ